MSVDGGGWLPAAAGPAGADPRTAEIAANLGAVHRRIGAAADAAGRDPAEITLIAVTKTFDAADVCRLVGLGVADVGENRDQEARAKAAAVAAELGRDPSPGGPVRWHFVGRLQRNKCRSVAGYATVVHSVDRVELVDALAAAAGRAQRPALTVLVQVSLDGDVTRGGALVADVPRLAAAVAAAPALRIGGVMAVAPQQADPDRAFADLAAVAAAVRADHPQATVISAGMSGDLEAAIRHGATHVRVGTALLGGRPPLVG